MHFSQPSDISSHVNSDDQSPDCSGSLTPQPRPPSNAETPQFKPTLTDSHRSRFHRPSLAFRHQNPIDDNDDAMIQSNPSVLRFGYQESRETLDSREHPIQQQLPSDPTPIPCGCPAEVPNVQHSSVSESEVLESLMLSPPENGAASDSLDQASRLLLGCDAQRSQKSLPTPVANESQMQQLESIDEYNKPTSIIDGSASQQSPGLHVETDDEFSLLVAAAACSYLMLQKEEEARRIALLGHTGSLLTQDSSTSSLSSLLDFETLLAGPVESCPMDINPSNQTSSKFSSTNTNASRCETTSNSNGNEDSSSTTNSMHNNNNHLPTTSSSSVSDDMILNFSTPLSQFRPTADFWNRSSTTTHRVSSSSLSAVVVSSPLGHDCSTQSSSINPQNAEDDSDRMLMINSNNDDDNFINPRIPSPYYNNNTPNDIYVSRQHIHTSLYPSLSQSSRSQPSQLPPPPPTRNGNNQAMNSQQPKSPSVHPSSLLFARGVGGRHFSPPMILAHPEEFRNPSSFLKVYGDPLCGLDEVTTSGTPPKSQLSMNGKNGNWFCSKCQNVNYPRRFRCNKCNEIRDAVGDAIVSDYALRVYHHHFKTYKKLNDGMENSTLQSSLLCSTSMGFSDEQKRRKSSRFSPKLPRYQQEHYNSNNNNNRQSTMTSSPLGVSFSSARLFGDDDDDQTSSSPTITDYFRHATDMHHQQPETNQSLRRFNSHPAASSDHLSLPYNHRGISGNNKAYNNNNSESADGADSNNRIANHVEPFNRHRATLNKEAKTAIGAFNEFFDFLDDEFQTPVKSVRHFDLQSDEKNIRAERAQLGSVTTNMQSPSSMGVTHFGTPEKKSHFSSSARRDHHSDYNCTTDSSSYRITTMNNNNSNGRLNVCGVDPNSQHGRLKLPSVEQRYGLQGTTLSHNREYNTSY